MVVLVRLAQNEEQVLAAIKRLLSSLKRSTQPSVVGQLWGQVRFASIVFTLEFDSRRLHQTSTDFGELPRMLEDKLVAPTQKSRGPRRASTAEHQRLHPRAAARAALNVGLGRITALTLVLSAL